MHKWVYFKANDVHVLHLQCPALSLVQRLVSFEIQWNRMPKPGGGEVIYFCKWRPIDSLLENGVSTVTYSAEDAHCLGFKFGMMYSEKVIKKEIEMLLELIELSQDKIYLLG